MEQTSDSNINSNSNSNNNNKIKIVSLSKITNVKNNNILFEVVEEQINNIENKNIYSIARMPYISSEFIPSNIIPIIMNHHFPSNELLLSYNENHGIYKIQIMDLLVDSITNWEYNRPPDMARCPDIARYIYHSKKPMDTMLYLTFTNIKETFEVLDGIHRLTALKIIQEENSKSLELLCPGDFGSNNDANWLFNQYIMVNIRFNATLGELIEAFKNLNKSQTVPDLYIKDVKKEKKEIIEEIVNEWIVRYKKHFSSSANPIMGNTNRNKFVELLDKLYDKHKIHKYNGNDLQGNNLQGQSLRKILEDGNINMMTKIPAKASIDIRLKCKESGCYLFLYKNDVLEQLL